MVKLNEKANILIKYFVEGKSKRQIAKESARSRNTVKKYIKEHKDKLSRLNKTLDKDEIIPLIESLVKKPSYDSSNRSKRKLTKEIIKEINKCLEKNKKKKAQGNHKQLMKKIDIHDYLASEGYDISYSSVCKYIRNENDEKKEAFIKQVYKPGEQTDHDDGDFDNIDPDNIEAKDGTKLGSDILQNPSDPDATFRQKYEANIVEFFDENNSVIKSYDFKPNIYSDQKFSANTLDKLTDDPIIKTEQGNPFKLFMDGAYYTYKLVKKAIDVGIKYMPGELTGKKPSADKMSFYENFNLDSDYENILSCANDKKPDYQEKNHDKNLFYAIFDKQKCAGCKLKSRIKSKKKYNSVSFTEKRYDTGKLRKTMGEKEYIKECNQRAGVEGVPSVFRRKYNVDDMPVRGEVCQKIWFGFKVAAVNFKKLLKGLKPATP